MIERLEHSDGLGAIYPPMMYSVMALDVLGYAEDDPVRVEALRQFDKLMVDEGRALLFPAVLFAGVGYGLWRLTRWPRGSGHPARRDARRTGCSTREVRRKGDWAVKRPGVEPSGWAFEYSNEFYPDIDDTAMAMLALERGAGIRRPAREGLPAARAGTGCWPCNRATAAGRPSTPTTTGIF